MIKGKDLFDQLGWHWDAQLRPRLADIADEEYLWEPVPGCWSVRESVAGVFTVDWAWPQPGRLR